MALLTTKGSTTASVPDPSEVKLIMVAGSSQRQFLILLKLELLHEGIKVFESVESNVHVREACMAVQLHSLTRQIQFRFVDLFIAVATHFPAESSNVDKLSIYK